MNGVRIIAEITGLNRTSIYKWMKPKEQSGTGGYIPSRHMRVLRDEAVKRGIELPPELLIGERAAA
jgi:predicted DNA-binding transcriptional regulator AlpA